MLARVDMERLGRWLRLALACLALVFAGGAPARAQTQAGAPVTELVLRHQTARTTRAGVGPRRLAQRSLVWERGLLARSRLAPPLRHPLPTPMRSPRGAEPRLYLRHAVLLR